MSNNPEQMTTYTMRFPEITEDNVYTKAFLELLNKIKACPKRNILLANKKIAYLLSELSKAQKNMPYLSEGKKNKSKIKFDIQVEQIMEYALRNFDVDLEGNN